MGDNPTRERARNPVTRIAGVEETKPLKSIDKAILGMVSESPGRNESEPIGGLVKYNPRRPSPLWSGEGNTGCRRLAEATERSGGVVGAAR